MNAEVRAPLQDCTNVQAAASHQCTQVGTKIGIGQWKRRVRQQGMVTECGDNAVKLAETEVKRRWDSLQSPLGLDCSLIPHPAKKWK